MDYRANFETAQTYLEAGLKDKGVESLCKIYNSLRNEGINKDRETFLKLTPLMAKLAMENGKVTEAARFIDEGLSIDHYDCDLLFLSVMNLWDQGRHDEMFAALVSYLISISMQDIALKKYRYVNDLSINKVFNMLVPSAYGNSVAHEETSHIVKELAAKMDNPYITRLANMLEEIDQRRAMETR